MRDLFFFPLQERFLKESQGRVLLCSDALWHRRQKRSLRHTSVHTATSLTGCLSLGTACSNSMHERETQRCSLVSCRMAHVQSWLLLVVGGNIDVYVINRIGVRFCRSLVDPLEQSSVYKFLFPASVPHLYIC